MDDFYGLMLGTVSTKLEELEAVLAEVQARIKDERRSLALIKRRYEHWSDTEPEPRQ